MNRQFSFYQGSARAILKHVIQKKEPEPPKPVLKTFSKKLEFDQEHYLVQVIGDEEKTKVYEQLKVRKRAIFQY